MKQLTAALTVIFFLISNAFAQSSSQYEWTLRDSSVYSQDVIWNVTTDKDGDVYIISKTSGTVYLGDTSFSSTGSNFTYVAKLNPAGHVLWVAKTSGGSCETGGLGVNENKTCYIGGWFTGTVTFGAFSLSPAPGFGGSSSYYAAIDSNGNFISATRNFSGSTFLNGIGGDILFTADNDVMFMENRELILPFTFIAKITYILNKKNSTGSLVTKAFGSVYAKLFTADDDENMYAGGNYDTTVIVNGLTFVPAGSSDYYLTKLNSSATALWTKKYSSNGYDAITVVKADADDNIYVSGYFYGDSLKIEGTTLYNPAPGTIKHMIIKYDAAGNLLWVISDGNTPFVSSVTIDAATGNIVLAATFSTTITLGATTLIPVSAPDILIAELDADGNFLSAHSIETSVSTGTVVTYDRWIQTPNILYQCGYYKGTATFGDAVYTTSLPTNMDGFISKMSYCIVPAEITPSGATTFCKGGNVTLSAPAGTGYTYQWKKNGVNLGGATAINYIANKTGNYSVVVTDADCSNTSATVTVTVNPKATATVTTPMGTDLCGFTSLKLKANNGTGLSYQWIKGGSNIAGATGQIYLATTIGNYKVKVTNSYGCSKTSATTAITSSCKLDDTAMEDILIYPNPNDGRFTIDIDLQNENSVAIKIFSATGEFIYADAALASGNIYLPGIISSGMYVMQVVTKGRTQYCRFTIE